MNKKTRPLEKEEYFAIMDAMETGGTGFRPNKSIAFALKLEANLGIRLSDIVPYENKTTGKASTGLRLCDIKKECGRYHLDIIEQKTGKQRTFTVHPDLYTFIQEYALDNGIAKNEPLCDISERRIQKYLQTVCFYLGLEDISTHSFRKFFATSIYNNNDYNIVLVQQLLQHSSPAITQKYLGVSSKQIEDALAKHICL